MAAHPAAQHLAPTTPAPAAADRGRRSDIQGLRAVAVVLVLLFHAGVPLLPGGYVGVDAFFVISGFLITGLLLREALNHGTISLTGFYARRARRLLPAAATVLVVVLLIAVTVLPVTRRESIAWDVLTSATYVVNLRLASGAVDYLASEQAASPVQHYWSLAVEEQFYVLWPVLVLACCLVARRWGLSLRLTLGVVLAAVCLPSLAWSWWLTGTSPGEAYFVTTTRVWELGVGAGLALAAPALARLPRRLAGPLAATGVVAVVGSAAALGTGTAFPGLIALVPVLGTAAVLAAGCQRGPTLVGRALAWQPLQTVGDLSYSLYLWHWPVVVAGTALWAAPTGTLDWPVGLLLVTASIVPASLTYALVERPVHLTWNLPRRPGGVLAVVAVCTLVPIAGAVAITRTVDPPPAAAAQDGPAARFGAGSLGASTGAEPTPPPPLTTDTVAGAVPVLTAAADDNADVYEDGCHQDQESDELLSCTYGDPDSKLTVVLAGDSHAAQWQPALRLLAEERGWRLETYTKSSCGMFDVDVLIGDPPTPYVSCTGWNERLRERLTGPSTPDLVVTTGSNSYAVLVDGRPLTREQDDEALVDSYARTWDALAEQDVPVLVLANTPWVGVEVPDCLALNDTEPTECEVPRPDAMERSGTEQVVAGERTGVPVADLTDWICPGESCPPIIGGVVVWRDAHHLTATYASSLTPVLARAVDAVLG